MTLDIDALQHLCDAATPIRVTLHLAEGGGSFFEIAESNVRVIIAQFRKSADYKFYFAASTALPKALTEIRRLTDEVASLRASQGEATGAEPIGCPCPGACSATALQSEWSAKLATLESEILRPQNDLGLRNARERVLYKWIANLIVAKRESEAARSAEIQALQHDVTRLREIQVEWSARVEALEVEIAQYSASMPSDCNSKYRDGCVDGLIRALEIFKGTA